MSVFFFFYFYMKEHLDVSVKKTSFNWSGALEL